jgi:quercetin dioxygenase-like cupin family protein
MAEQRWHRLYFDEWVEREGLDLLRGYKVDNLYTLPLKYWARTEGFAAQIQLDGTGEQNAAYVCEIPPGGKLRPIRHLYEELVYVLSGRGITSVWLEGRKKHQFEWKAGSLFAIPLNAWYQHFNGSGTDPARYVAVTTAPIMMNLLRNDDCIFDNDAIFAERYPDEDDYFYGSPELTTFDGWERPVSVAISNFFPDIMNVPFMDWNRGGNARGAQYELVSGSLSAHTMEAPGGGFTKLHRHGPGAHVLWLQGEGYTVMWPDGGQMVKEYWGPGSMLVPPNWWWHQHCIASEGPALHLALKLNSRRHIISRASTGTLRSTRTGGSQLEFEDTPPEVLDMLKNMFAEECAKRGTTNRMIEIVGM